MRYAFRIKKILPLLCSIFLFFLFACRTNRSAEVAVGIADVKNGVDRVGERIAGCRDAIEDFRDTIDSSRVKVERSRDRIEAMFESVRRLEGYLKEIERLLSVRHPLTDNTGSVDDAGGS